MAHVSLFDGTLVHVGGEVKRFDRGAAIPEHADQDHVKLLVERGMVAEGAPVAGLVARHEGTGPFLLPDSTDDHSGDDPDGAGPMPAKSASRADWDAFAKSQGLSDEQVAGFSSKEDLQAHFGVA